MRVLFLIKVAIYSIVCCTARPVSFTSLPTPRTVFAQAARAKAHTTSTSGVNTEVFINLSPKNITGKAALFSTLSCFTEIFQTSDSTDAHQQTKQSHSYERITARYGCTIKSYFEKDEALFLRVATGENRFRYTSYAVRDIFIIYSHSKITKNLLLRAIFRYQNTI